MPMPSRRMCWGTDVRFVWTIASHLRKRERRCSDPRWKIVRCACLCVCVERGTGTCVHFLSHLTTCEVRGTICWFQEVVYVRPAASQWSHQLKNECRVNAGSVMSAISDVPNPKPWSHLPVFMPQALHL